MGWDAFAEPVERLYSWKDGRDGLGDPEHEAAFARASAEVKLAAGTADGFLHRAGLDVSDCGEELQRATGADCWPGEPVDEGGWRWSPERVRSLNDSAVWEERPGRLWAMLSAKLFLETCARLGLGVRFSL